jgi:hypothetical protein
MQNQDLIIKMVINNWNLQVGRATALIDQIGHVEIYKEVSPGKNRGIYILGHLVAYHDLIPEILGTGERSLPHLFEPFIKNPDNLDAQIPAYSEIRTYFDQVHSELLVHFDKLSLTDWFSRHEAMTDEDFEKDPSRNKLNVLINRISHFAYHLGQLRLLK